MEAAIGFALAAVIGIAATLIGLDRDRAFYPTVMVVIASYYALFAIMGGSMEALVAESVVFAGFLLVSALGFRRNLWLVVAALAAHGVFDLVHGRFIDNPVTPAWWPVFCLAYDVGAAGYLAWLLKQGRVRAVA